jgi:hypothetical protein
VPGDRRQAERGHAGVHPEHARIEHLFSLCEAHPSVNHPRDVGARSDLARALGP